MSIRLTESSRSRSVTLDLDGIVVEVWDTLVNPLRDVTAGHIHGITASMVRDAPTFEEVAGDIAMRLHGACFIAHNIPFDTRMLDSEYRRLAEELVVLRGIDTYVESGCRLSQACAVFDIDLSGAHRARTDAWAAAQLFLQVARTCDRGAPVAAPIGMFRTGRVLRREDVAPVRLDEPPLITYLARGSRWMASPFVSSSTSRFWVARWPTCTSTAKNERRWRRSPASCN